MQIDWFMLFTQMGNFLILVFLLRRFLYKPIVRAMDEREAKIAARLNDAEQKQRTAQQEIERYQKERQELQEMRSEMIEQAEKEAATRKKELLQKAREEIEKTEQIWHEVLQRERETFLRDLRGYVGQQSTAIARQTLADLADVELERKVVLDFVRRIKELATEEKEGFTESIRESEGKVLVSSAFRLPNEMRKTLIEAVEENLAGGEQVEVRFEVSTELVSGIELQADGRIISWNITSYLDTLEERITEALEERTRDEPGRNTK